MKTLTNIMDERRVILSILVENQPGSLSRIANLFSARAYNIESLSVAPTHDVTQSRMTVITYGDDATIEQITKQINKLIEVFKVSNITEERHLERELMLIKIVASGEKREEMKRLSDIFRASIVDVATTTYTIQITGDQKKLNAFIEAVGLNNIVDITRTGVCGINRS